jgi:hypothetical protein
MRGRRESCLAARTRRPASLVPSSFRLRRRDRIAVPRRRGTRVGAHGRSGRGEANRLSVRESRRLGDPHGVGGARRPGGPSRSEGLNQPGPDGPWRCADQFIRRKQNILGSGCLPLSCKGRSKLRSSVIGVLQVRCRERSPSAVQRMRPCTTGCPATGYPSQKESKRPAHLSLRAHWRNSSGLPTGSFRRSWGVELVRFGPLGRLAAVGRGPHGANPVGPMPARGRVPAGPPPCRIIPLLQFLFSPTRPHPSPPRGAERRATGAGSRAESFRPPPYLRATGPAFTRTPPSRAGARAPASRCGRWSRRTRCG